MASINRIRASRTRWERREKGPKKTKDNKEEAAKRQCKRDLGGRESLSETKLRFKVFLSLGVVEAEECKVSKGQADQKAAKGWVLRRRRVAIRRGPMRQLAKHIIFVKGLLCWRVIESLPLDNVIVRLIILVIIGEREGFGGIQGDGNRDGDRQGGGQGVLDTNGRRQSRRLARLYRVHRNMKLGG